MKFFAEKGKIYCPDCDRRLLPAPDDFPQLGIIETFCRVHEDTQRSWWSTSQTDVYTELVYDNAKHEIRTWIGWLKVVSTRDPARFDVVLITNEPYLLRRTCGDSNAAVRVANRLAWELKFFEPESY